MADIVLIFLVLFIAGLGAAISIFYIKKSGVDRVQSEAIRDLERRLTDLMQTQLREIRGSVDGTSRAMNEQIRSFTKEATQIREELTQVQKRMKDISSFQEIFRSPKLRGQWGEASLEHVLSQHFPSELYSLQYRFSSGEQVDAILRLPNEKVLPIDAKFSLENFVRMVNTSLEDEKNFYRQEFLKDTKLRIDEIASKYILPGENTVDFALMYVPAEAIYYELIFHLRKEDITDYAWKKRVVITSPNTIYLTLRTIEHWFRDTQLSKHTQRILKRLARVYQDAKKLGGDFDKLGTHLRNATSAFDRSERRLSLLGDRVENLIVRREVKQVEAPEETK